MEMFARVGEEELWLMVRWRHSWIVDDSARPGLNYRNNSLAFGNNLIKAHINGRTDTSGKSPPEKFEIHKMLDNYWSPPSLAMLVYEQGPTCGNFESYISSG